MVLVTVCTFGTMSIVYRMTSRVQKFASDIANKTSEVADEKKRTEMLLYQVRPFYVILNPNEIQSSLKDRQL